MKICANCSEIKHEIAVKQEMMESGHGADAVGVNHLLELAYDDWPPSEDANNGFGGGADDDVDDDDEIKQASVRLDVRCGSHSPVS